jgi:thioredoxin-dependent peroxiredoxin
MQHSAMTCSSLQYRKKQTQNPPALAAMGVRPPLPAPHDKAALPLPDFSLTTALPVVRREAQPGKPRQQQAAPLCYPRVLTLFLQKYRARAIDSYPAGRIFVKKKLVFSLAISATLCAPAFAALKPGDRAPEFSAPASLAGKNFHFSLEKALKKGPVVVYFYPSAYTGGCDLEAHTFAQDKDQFTAAGASIIGVSEDSIARLDQFSADPQYCAGRFPVASDPSGKIGASYGVTASPGRPGLKDVRGVAIDHGFLDRVTFVIGKDGKIVAAFSSRADHLSPDAHVQKALETVQQLTGK